MFIDERHRAILDIISTNGRISVGEIQEKFNVSVDSARRDLRILEEKGLLKRTHGGAIPTRQIASGKPSKITAKDITVVKENYMAIALKAVSMINNNDVIFITSATVGYFMAQNLPSDIRIRVVTNSIIIAEELRKKDNISVILLGGEMDNKGNCYDAFAVDMITRLRFDKCFITSACISSKFGLSIQKSQAISFWNAVIDSSKETIGLFPTEKIGFESIISICPANRLNTLITDWDVSEEDLTTFDDQGIKIVVVEKE
ncbi:DeoR/GlpR family DNA-binding transcription regulator [Oceanirhabdus sp. W0125-5]|uniref:DeoR/GlpR family DNA-binding transcription regulator n=1 Tax=Oceanirhabdus sp. W0125-5 TaxID=2999116 RepID=UPI0022F32C00|nr:DeoR/GlpR family DNA-binding transcription regulator [Oceanirhabdus sp. W0125-5]WBW96849.1 DeoR/GlpR family DNA-binding transcription regulator [Oceanirhabdus sp. W0125-5]